MAFDGYIEAVVKESGTDIKKFSITCPEVQDVSSGFDASLASELNELKTDTTYHPGFDEVTQIMRSLVQYKTSGITSILSCGASSQGYFDLVVSAERNGLTYVNFIGVNHYFEALETRIAWATIHNVTFLEENIDAHGLIVLVGYQRQPLQSGTVNVLGFLS